MTGHSKDLKGPALPTGKDMALEDFSGMLLYNMPIMPTLCLKLAYYASIMLDAYYASNYAGIIGAGLVYGHYQD